MKIQRLTAVAAAALGLGALASAQGLGQGLSAQGSPHNFIDNLGGENDVAIAEIGTGGWNVRGELCRVCHVPHDHNRTTGQTVGYLWNHSLSQAQYTMYSSATLDGIIAAQPTGISKMCLGCHDGTVGIDTFDSHAGGNVFVSNYETGFQVPGPNLGTSLAATHPVSVMYDENADPGLRPKTSTFGASGTIEDVLEGGLVQCSSCHDVHDQPGEAVPGTHLLRVAQTGASPSGLCLSCHIK